MSGKEDTRGGVIKMLEGLGLDAQFPNKHFDGQIVIVSPMEVAVDGDGFEA